MGHLGQALRTAAVVTTGGGVLFASGGWRPRDDSAQDGPTKETHLSPNVSSVSAGRAQRGKALAQGHTESRWLFKHRSKKGREAEKGKERQAEKKGTETVRSRDQGQRPQDRERHKEKNSEGQSLRNGGQLGLQEGGRPGVTSLAHLCWERSWQWGQLFAEKPWSWGGR